MVISLIKQPFLKSSVTALKPILWAEAGRVLGSGPGGGRSKHYRVGQRETRLS